MNDTHKITITIRPYESWVADLLTAELADLGFDTFEETPVGFDAFITGANYDKSGVEALLQEKNDRFLIEWKEEVIPSQNWNEVWEKNYFQPLVINDQVVVRAPFHREFPPCPIEIVIDPQMAFGTGNHETTSLVMEVLLTAGVKGKKVLDMGCGTGILAILASKLGASLITAIDNDPWSFRAVAENILLNHTPNVTPSQGNADLLGGEKYDLVMANIQKNVIVNDIHRYASVLLPGGLLITSGFFLTDLPDIRQAAEKSGLLLNDFREKNNWVAAVFLLP